MSSGPSLPSIEAVLQTLRRGQRQLARNPRAAVQAAVKQLLAAAPTPAEAAPQPTYRIDDLARVSGVTVRNIRAYQERGLLPPPERVGRTAVFSEAHLARLRIISSMLERGYTASNILEMLRAWESGRDLGQVLGLEGALVRHSGDEPVTMSMGDARRAAGSTEDYERMISEGLIEPAGNRARVLRPRLLEAFGLMRQEGMSTDALMSVFHGVQPHADDIARILVEAGALQLGPRLLSDDVATSADIAELVELLTRFRALALSAVTSTLATSIESAIEDLLAAYLAERVLDQPDAG
ncbi:MAG: MerR family transcriptional regulator [Nocardioides sp.]